MCEKWSLCGAFFRLNPLWSPFIYTNVFAMMAYRWCSTFEKRTNKRRKKPLVRQKRFDVFFSNETVTINIVKKLVLYFLPLQPYTFPHEKKTKLLETLINANFLHYWLFSTNCFSCLACNRIIPEVFSSSKITKKVAISFIQFHIIVKVNWMSLPSSRPRSSAKRRRKLKRKM